LSKYNREPPQKKKKLIYADETGTKASSARAIPALCRRETLGLGSENIHPFERRGDYLRYEKGTNADAGERRNGGVREGRQGPYLQFVLVKNQIV